MNQTTMRPMVATGARRMAAPSSAREDYLATQVATASPAQLTMMLFEGADRYLQAASQLLEAGVSLTTASVCTEALTRAGAIINQLAATLDLELWPEGAQLQALYVWISDELVQVNISKKVLTSASTQADRDSQVLLAERVATARQMLADIADAFRQARAAS